MVVLLLLGRQNPAVLGSLMGDHQRCAGQIPAGSLVTPVCPDADPVLFGGESSCMDSVHLPNGIGSSLSSVMSPAEPTDLLDIPIITPSALV